MEEITIVAAASAALDKMLEVRILFYAEEQPSIDAPGFIQNPNAPPCN